MRTILWEDGKVVYLNQRKLPKQLEYVCCDDYQRIAKAIKTLEIRGAPAIGVAAAMGLALVAYNSRAKGREELLRRLEQASCVLRKTRPTAYNLFWAIDRVNTKVASTPGTVEEVRSTVIAEALAIGKEDLQTNKMIGINGASLIEDGDVVGTICNAGWLATSGEYGTALSVIKIAHEQGKRVSVIALETRPILQGARLTAFELKQDKIDVRVIPDGAIGYCFSKRMIDKFICGADRIIVSSGGHVINKVGTNTVSIVAKHYKIPFYVAAPLSTFDFNSSLKDVIIEERDPREVAEIFGRRIIPEGVSVFNPAFDITSPRLVEAIITERGIIHPPFKKEAENLLKLKIRPLNF
ncbi:MAG: methylthioribose-phosphate isomerase [Thermoproteota archaeon]|nr:methylthioribose-phosphate isomerase [Thermoproteota archaeon]